MPVYNGEDYVQNAIESVLNQTYTEFDFLIINDGSTDNSEELILNYSDPRIKYEPNEKNMGLIKTLNKGLKLINGTYIIRMDADDICMADRFEKQIAYMDQNLKVAVSGTSVKKFTESGTLPQEFVKTEPADLKTQLLFGSPMRHPSVIIRNQVIKDEGYLYDENLDTVEDYGMWQTISEKHQLGNIGEVLLEYRINELGITQQADKKKDFRDNQHKVIYQRIFNSLNIDITAEELTLYREFITKRLNLKTSNSRTLANLLMKIKLAATKKEYNVTLLEQYYKRFLTDTCLNNQISLMKWKKIMEKDFSKLFAWNLKDDAKYFGKTFRR